MEKIRIDNSKENCKFRANGYCTAFACCPYRINGYCTR